ncbi:MAG: GerMN domain-containing protein [Bacilli bacterium]
MLKQKALRKILITSITIVILLMIYLMPTNNKSSINTLNIDKKIEYIDKKVGYIYLLNDNDLLVKVNVLMNDSDSLNEKVIDILNNLLNNTATSKELRKVIPSKTKILNTEIDDDYLSVSFSKDILNIDEKYQEKLIESIAYSIFEIGEIKRISIYVEEENINKYFSFVPEIITRDFGINKKYDIKSFRDIQKVVVYYIDEIDNNNYFVPVTNYINDDEEKIKIIIESLSSSYIYEPNLISLLNNNTELINYEINDDIMLLNFNNSIFISDGNILEEVIYTISNSVFDSYDVNKVVFNVENKTISEISK